ncbi:NUDIX hydrolase [Hydrogenophaga aquatica]
MDTPTPDTPRDAASVVLLRDGPTGLEVLLQRRNARAGVLGGMYVFPGGKLDASDFDGGWLTRLDQSPQALQDQLAEGGTPVETAVALYLAALREMFEEAGILLAEPEDGQASRTGWHEQLHEQLRAGQAWPAALARLGLRTNTRGMRPWSRWITPRNPPVGTPRFDTRFFLAVLPTGQLARHDDHEAVESLWLAPQTALQRYWDREIELIPPQLMGLAQLARHADTASAWREALERQPPCVQPEQFDEDGVRVMCYPGDPRHPVTARALPGPTRLRFVQRRFEPVNGFAGWLE